MAILIPALDLIDGKVVRLLKGDYNNISNYECDFLTQFKYYEAQGATWLHLVDLSAAKDPSKRQINIIKSICQNININIQVGGGIRSIDDIKILLDIGVKRVIIGSLIIQKPELCAKLLTQFGNDNLVFAMDVRPQNDAYFVAINAWQKTSDKDIIKVLKYYEKYKLKHVLCTDISKDGTLKGPNIKLYKYIKKNFPNIHLQASGGISSLNDLKALNDICSGIIVGKALLEGKFELKEGIKCLQSE